MSTLPAIADVVVPWAAIDEREAALAALIAANEARFAWVEAAVPEAGEEREAGA